jgi:predicted ArsR family transcriptional regulator
MSTSLHPLEQKILATLTPAGRMTFEALVGATALNEDQVRRALQWLSSKGLVTIAESAQSRLEVARRPPELELFRKVTESTRLLTVEDLKEEFASPEEFSAAFGRARSAGWVKVKGKRCLRSGS